MCYLNKIMILFLTGVVVTGMVTECGKKEENFYGAVLE